MAGLVAGDDSEFGGVAPQASVVDVKVATADGSTDLRRVLAGIQKVADMPQAPDVVMLALSTQSPLPPYLDPLTLSLDRLWDRGMTVVVASGNGGEGELSSPATDPQLLVVGAQDEKNTATRGDDEVADFSAYGSSFGFSRPDLVAPGVSLISTSPTDSNAYTGNTGSVVRTGYLKGTGTSMAAAVAAGAVAALVAERDLTPDEVKRLLVGTAYSTSALQQVSGAGRGGLDLGRAMKTDVVPELPGSSPTSPKFGPKPQDAQAWADFGRAWAAGDVKALAEAWVALSPQTRKWAATAWSLAALMRALQADDSTFAGRNWAGRNWAGRNWASVDWLAFAWTLRMSATDPELQDEFQDWAGRNWAGRNWAGRNWAGRNWADIAWVGRNWADEAWAGRNWADYAWTGRNWADDAWTGRNWADFAFAGRNWATGTWAGRNWAVKHW
jgi:serine protease AprX